MTRRTVRQGAAQLNRRALLRGTLGLTALAAAGQLSGCSGEETATGTGSGSVPTGGRLRLGAAGAATQTLNVLTATGMTDYIAMFALYDSLAILQGERVELRLAESIEPNADATEFTVRIRDGVTFHDGRPCTADDVRYSLLTLADPDQSPNFSQFYGDVEVAGLTVVDPHTVRIPLRRPRADFLECGLGVFSVIFPDGTSGERWEEGVGSGPFTLATSGGGSRVLQCNPEYWDDVALLDEVEIVVIADAETRLNALRGGEIDYAYSISPAGAASVDADPTVTVVRGGPANSQTFALEMNMRQPPFDDPDLRLAMKLLVDREALVETVLFGHGAVGNDVMGQGLVGFNSDLPQRERDVDRARSLLSSSGVSEVTLRVAELAPGMTDAARLIAEQSAEAGLTVTLDEAAADTYFSDLDALMSSPLQLIPWTNRPAATFAAVFTGSNGSFNITGVGGPEYDQRLADMQATLDDAARQERLADLQRYVWENGGSVLWGFAEQLDATAPGVDGITYAQTLPRLDKISMT